ncbi:hypothetical protein OHA77_09150 [Streptosporangium sp. NBC_01639]|uniref:hypothetical protein n=1 Tax=Streptosporangium sp. NBC_01639 TaxID=2975948 RepID=UPI003864E695|nr:hypothetical protein OHA77_09150 [Streptosporangium sp. NBC_01639]
MRILDNAAADAGDLESRHPGWVVLWRCWARRFWAFPLWITDAPEPLEAGDIQELLDQMRHVEFLTPFPLLAPNPESVSAEPVSPATGPGITAELALPSEKSPARTTEPPYLLITSLPQEPRGGH